MPHKPYKLGHKLGTAGLLKKSLDSGIYVLGGIKGVRRNQGGEIGGYLTYFSLSLG
jgi:hypothetical protein